MKQTIAVAALLAFSLLAVSCSGSDSEAGVASLEAPIDATLNQEQAGDETASDPVSDEEAILAFAACLRAFALKSYGATSFASFSDTKRRMDGRGFEPPTSALRTQRSPS